MGNCYSIDHIAEDHIHTDITFKKEKQRGTTTEVLPWKILLWGGGL